MFRTNIGDPPLSSSNRYSALSCDWQIWMNWLFCICIFGLLVSWSQPQFYFMNGFIVLWHIHDNKSHSVSKCAKFCSCINNRYLVLCFSNPGTFCRLRRSHLQSFFPFWDLNDLLANVSSFHHGAKRIWKELRDFRNRRNPEKRSRSNMRTSHIFNAVCHRFQRLWSGSRETRHGQRWSPSNPRVTNPSSPWSALTWPTGWAHRRHRPACSCSWAL